MCTQDVDKPYHRLDINNNQLIIARVRTYAKCPQRYYNLDICKSSCPTSMRCIPNASEVLTVKGNSTRKICRFCARWNSQSLHPVSSCIIDCPPTDILVFANGNIILDHYTMLSGRTFVLRMQDNIKVTEVNVLETHKQSRISMCIKFRYISDKYRVK